MTEIRNAQKPAPELPPSKAQSSRAIRLATQVMAQHEGHLIGLAAIIALVVVFGALKPNVFLAWSTFQLILTDNAIIGLLAIAALVPLCCGLIDLSVGSIMGCAAVVAAKLTSGSPVNVLLLFLAAAGLSAVFGTASGGLIARYRLNSLIVTLGISSVAAGVTTYLTAGNTLTATLPASLSSFGTGTFWKVPGVALVFLGVAACVYIWLDYTPSGRRALASGDNEPAALLAGVRVARLRLWSMIFSAVVSGVAGVLLLSTVGSATDQIGPAYLLPAIAAVFLGSTLNRGRPTAVGTVLAVYILGTGIKGLQIMGAAAWVNSVFNGLVLILAVFAAALRSRRRDRTLVARRRKSA